MVAKFPPLIGQLLADPYVLDLRDLVPVETQNYGISPEASDGRAVLLVSRSADRELSVVEALLLALRIPFTRLNADGLDDVNVMADLGAGTLEINGSLISPSVAWVRHFSSRAIPGNGNAELNMFYSDSWDAFVRQLSAISPAVIGASGPGQLAQLRDAAELGISVPRTIMTTIVGAAARKLDCPRIIVKATDNHFVEARPGRLAGIFPQIMDASDVSRSGSRLGAPVLVQECVEYEAELRVYWIDGSCYAYRVTKDSPAALWTGSRKVAVEEILELPRAVQLAIEMLAAKWCIRYAAFDFLIRDGDPVFLEANLDGDWRWFESRAKGWTVSFAAALMLSDLHNGGIE